MDHKLIWKGSRLLLRMEWMKTWCRLNIAFSSLVFILVLIQVAFLVRMDIGAMNLNTAIAGGVNAGGAAVGPGAIDIYRYAARYTDNIAFTFLPSLLLVNIAREFDYAIVQRSLVSGLSRPGFFNGKLIQLGLFSLFALVMGVLFSMLVAVIYQVPLLWDFEKLSLYFVVTFSLGSLALMIAFILKKRSRALAVFMVYALLENTIVALRPEKTILLPFQTNTRLLRQGIYQWPEFCMAMAYAILFLVIAYQVFRRSDLK